MSPTDDLPGQTRRWLGRVGRLSLKELKEILRDRRTIATLVLMPLIVYPILSVILQRFLITAYTSTDGVKHVVGVESELAGRVMKTVYSLGRPEKQDLLEGLVSDHQGSLPSGLIPQGVVPSQINIAEMGDVEASVRDGEVDLGVKISGGKLEQFLEPGNEPLEFELIYRADSAASRHALRITELCLRNVQDVYATHRLEQLGDRGQLPTRIAYRSVASAQTALSLASLIPLILVLMTITGAVYPAIDLTAGERERGTLEALIAAPVPRLGLLIAKYVAVVTIALLTALANLAAMSLTLYSSGIGAAVFGDSLFSFRSLAAVLLLLLLFAMFFSAVLLIVTSFARSFKEAQAYLIPLVLLSLGPSLVCLVPGLRLTGLLAAVPLVNIVLLARDVFQWELAWGAALVVVTSTALYAAGAIGLAARIFGSDAILYGSAGGWRDLMQRPLTERQVPGVSAAIMLMAILLPLYVLAVGALVQLGAESIASRLVLASAITIFLFGVLPWLVAWRWRWQIGSTFRLSPARFTAYLAALLFGLSLWPLVSQIVILGESLGISPVTVEKRELVETLLDQCRELPLGLLLATIALIPAVSEELFFRGFLFSALLGRTSPRKAILGSAFVFGLFHLLASSALATERFIPSLFMGVVLGWTCWRSGSVLPGMVLHACHNGLLVTIFYYRDELQRAGFGGDPATGIPPVWIVAAAIGVMAAWFVMRASPRLYLP